MISLRYFYDVWSISSIQRSQEQDDVNLFSLLKWTLSNANSFFHLLHQEGIWIHPDLATVIVKHGFNISDFKLQNSIQGHPYDFYKKRSFNIYRFPNYMLDPQVPGVWDHVA